MNESVKEDNNTSEKNGSLRDAHGSSPRSPEGGSPLLPLVLIVLAVIALVGGIAVYSFFPHLVPFLSSERATSTPTGEYTPSWEEEKGVYAYECPAGSQHLAVPKDYPSIQSAVDAAKSGTIVVVESGTYEENVDLKPGICLEAKGGVIVRGKAGAPVITAADKTKISGFNFETSVTEAEVDNWHLASAIYAGDKALVNVSDNVFSGCHIAVAGETGAQLFIKANRINCQNEAYGLALTHSSVLVQENAVSNCSFAEYFYGCSGAVSNEQISASLYGMSTYRESSLKIHENTFTDIDDAAVNTSEVGSDVIKDNIFKNVGREKTTNQV